MASALFTFASGRQAKVVVCIVAFVLLMVAGSFAGKLEGAQKNDSASFLPSKAESSKALKKIEELPSGELVPAVVVFQREGGLTESDRKLIASKRAELNKDLPKNTSPAPPPSFSKNGTSALLTADVKANGETEDLLNVADEFRELTSNPPSGLEVKLTGPLGLSADAVEVFESIDGTLLLASLSIVFILLILIYRSPIFWLIPFLSVIFAETGARALAYALAEAGVTVNGQSAGILPVLVFGAGTDYALLLVARYREELRNHEDKHQAVKIAVRRAGPAIVASGLTVIAALMCLTLAEVNGTAGLGPIAAMGIGVAMFSMLVVLPALLALTGRRAFWPFIPRFGSEGSDETHGFWRKIGERIDRRPRTIWIATVVLLGAMALGLTDFNTNLTQGNSFRNDVESVQGQKLIEQAFPAGSNAPTDVIVPDPARAEAVAAEIRKQPYVAAVREAERGEPGVRLQATLKEDPYSVKAFDLIPELRDTAKQAGGVGTLVGGPTAQEADLRISAERDTKLIVPIALAVVFIILIVLLRALVAPLLLMGTVVLSFLAALGIGAFVFENIFDFPGSDPGFPLFAFIFLVALGVDYNIFLMARVREETQRHGTEQGTLRGLAVTGSVITSAGLVLAGTFLTLAVLPLVFLTEIGFTVAVGVLLDTFIVRSILVPALSIDIGKRIWWPSKLAKFDRQSNTEQTVTSETVTESV